MIVLIWRWISETDDNISKQVFVAYKIDMFELKPNLTNYIVLTVLIIYQLIYMTSVE
jgi:hypothetical protein